MPVDGMPSLRESAGSLPINNSKDSIGKDPLDKMLAQDKSILRIDEPETMLRRIEEQSLD